MKPEISKTSRELAPARSSAACPPRRTLLRSHGPTRRPAACRPLPSVIRPPKPVLCPPTSGIRRPAATTSHLSLITFPLPPSPAPAIMLSGRCPGPTYEGCVVARGGLRACGEAEMDAMGAGVGEPCGRGNEPRTPHGCRMSGCAPSSSLNFRDKHTRLYEKSWLFSGCQACHL